MSLTIETGAVVPGADSYVTVEELRAYAEKRGATVPADDEDCEPLLIKACDYLQAQAGRYKGNTLQWDQPLAWPRECVVVSGYELPSNEIPNDIKNAQMALAIEAQTLDLMPTVDAAAQKGAVIEETVDVISTKYAVPVSQLTQSTFAKANAYLAKFYRSGPNVAKVVRT